MTIAADQFFKKLASHLKNELPFVVYRKPDDRNINGLLQHNDDLFFVEDYTESGFAFAPFQADKKAILIPQNTSETIQCLVETYENGVSAFISEIEDDKAKESHIKLVEKAITAIENSETKKVVVSRKKEIGIEKFDMLSVFKKLVTKYPQAFCYVWYHPKGGMWIGATPETLLQVKNNQFQTMALASTQSYQGSMNVLWGEKERQEQQFVTDYIVGNIQSLVKNISVSDVETVRAGSLLHLKTKITGNLIRHSNLEQVLYTLHPTPAVCGLPKEKARAFILENENYRREFYTGFLGELNLKEIRKRNPNRRNVENNAYVSVKTVSRLYVNLRCMQYRNKKLELYVGGGITKDSDAEQEWQETVDKTRTMLDVLKG
ncbi:chorismate-binding protein [Galbibacter sp. EGI 63066]|uniref:chorismate-binding protein n=1 Tax=Galbibacter sp. EGI 63066 TaxID=2993559 RepID=UPI002249A00D|nr:chorismate-binding protein [Galbibacter sp. EGI 63066]MCX2680117.1 chorismate-binding protein [Galbibacter sp. EGI 63066]